MVEDGTLEKEKNEGKKRRKKKKENKWKRGG